MQDNRIICPCCNGEGRIIPMRPKELKFKKQMAIRLDTEGLTIRQIASRMGYKSPKSVQDLLT